GLASEVGGYRLFAKRTDSWEAIVAILISLDAEHSDYFHRVMRRCRALSNSTPEPDVQDLPRAQEQSMFERAPDREQRRDEQGYVTPAQARAFLEMSRRLPLGSDTMPAANPVASAYLRSLGDMKASQGALRSAPPSKEPGRAAPSMDHEEAAAALVDVLR